MLRTVITFPSNIVELGQQHFVALLFVFFSVSEVWAWKRTLLS